MLWWLATEREIFIVYWQVRVPSRKEAILFLKGTPKETIIKDFKRRIFLLQSTFVWGYCWDFELKKIFSWFQLQFIGPIKWWGFVVPKYWALNLAVDVSLNLLARSPFLLMFERSFARVIIENNDATDRWSGQHVRYVTSLKIRVCNLVSGQILFCFEAQETQRENGIKIDVHCKNTIWGRQKSHLMRNISQWINLACVWLILPNNHFFHYFQIHKELAATIRQVTDLFKPRLWPFSVPIYFSLPKTAEISRCEAEK